MRSNTPSLAFITLALSLYAAALTATTAHAEPLPGGAQQGHQLSDQNLFEVHLQRPASSQKRLPSEILKDLRERDEVAELPILAADEAFTTTAPVASTSAAPSSSSSPSSLAAASSSSSSSSTYSAEAVEITYTPRQPSHFIRHRRTKDGKVHGKRRLESSTSTLTFARDSDELASLWEVPEIIARAAHAYRSAAAAATDSSASAEEQQPQRESSRDSTDE